jgi:hypothetical protein
MDFSTESGSLYAMTVMGHTEHPNGEQALMGALRKVNGKIAAEGKFQRAEDGSLIVYLRKPYKSDAPYEAATGKSLTFWDGIEFNREDGQLGRQHSFATNRLSSLDLIKGEEHLKRDSERGSRVGRLLRGILGTK